MAALLLVWRCTYRLDCTYGQMGIVNMMQNAGRLVDHQWRSQHASDRRTMSAA